MSEREEVMRLCRECRCFTNHTTAMHQEAARIMCRNCNDVAVKDENEMCAECLSEMAAYYEPDEGGDA